MYKIIRQKLDQIKLSMVLAVIVLVALSIVFANKSDDKIVKKFENISAYTSSPDLVTLKKYLFDLIKSPFFVLSGCSAFLGGLQERSFKP